MSQSGSYVTGGGGGGGPLNTLTGNTGGAVSPTGNNINIVGSGTISVTGNPGTSTLTISSSGTPANSFPTDSGTATPSAGVLNVLSGPNINTTGSGNTVTVNLDNTISVSGSITSTAGNIIATLGHVNAGTTMTAGTGLTVSSFGRGMVRSSSAGALSSINGTNGQVIIAATGADPIWASLTAGSGISITPGANSISIAATGGGSGITTLDGDSGSATGATVTIAGGSNITTSASGAMVTVDLDSTVSIGGSMTAGTGFTATTGDVDIDAGSINLPFTNNGGTQGILYWNTLPYLHTYGGTSAYFGQNAGNTSSGGSGNVGIGTNALILNSGGNNVAVGSGTGASITSGQNNTAVGSNTLSSIVTGGSNTAIGHNAGSAYNGSEAFNIAIAHNGVPGESQKIRIGDSANQISTYIAGIYGVTPANSPQMATIGSDGEMGSAALPTSGIDTLDGDTGSAMGSTVTIAGSTNITTSAASSTVTVDLNNTISIIGSITCASFVDVGAGYFETTGPTVLRDSGSGNSLFTFPATNNIFLGLAAGNTGLTGNDNTGIGAAVLNPISTAQSCTAIGSRSQENNDTASENTSVGYLTLDSVNGAGVNNTVMGSLAGQSISTGTDNTAVGRFALRLIGIGSYNSCLGSGAGGALTTSDSDNILISNAGTAGDNNTIRLGTQGTGNGQQDSCFIAGIRGVTPAGTRDVMLIDTNGQLGSSAGTNGQVLIGSTGASPSWATVTAGSGISVTNGANSITIASSGGGMAWSEQTGTTQAMAVNTGYILNNAGVVTATLPATAAVGDVMEIVGKGSGGWLMAQNSGQTVHFGNQNTTTGVGGSLASTNRYDAICLVCITANTDFVVKSSVGNLTVV